MHIFDTHISYLTCHIWVRGTRPLGDIGESCHVSCVKCLEWCLKTHVSCLAHAMSGEWCLKEWCLKTQYSCLTSDSCLIFPQISCLAHASYLPPPCCVLQPEVCKGARALEGSYLPRACVMCRNMWRTLYKSELPCYRA